MRKKRSDLRGTILTEDKRSERFIRSLLVELGFKKKNFTFFASPKGQGAAEAWVLNIYAEEVKKYRSKNYQGNICLLAVRDGDKPGFDARKKAFDQKLQEENLNKRADDEAIANLVPTWSIETWLLALLDEKNVAEKESQKENFTDRFSRKETAEIKNAVKKWKDFVTTEVAPSSLKDGHLEMQKLFQ
ncbi:hypothetical protein KAI87_03070 [Myxococcota bacterium]|nr:hypothetical protein [Myxococcota bacterium]